MKEKIKELSNEELLKVYRMLLEHLDYLKSEKDKMEDDNK